jgi:GH18 family chitinase
VADILQNNLLEGSNTRISDDIKAYILSQFASLKSQFQNYFSDTAVAKFVFIANSSDGMTTADTLTTKKEKKFFAVSSNISLKNLRQ